MKDGKRRNLPGRGARMLSAVFALLLTGLLALTVLTAGGLRLLTDPEIHLRSALAQDAMDLQMARIEEKLGAIAEEYGLAPETLKALVTREDVEKLNESVVRWWTGAVVSGKLEARPAFHLEGAEEALRADEAWIAGMNPLTVNNAIYAVVGKAERAVADSAVLFRDMLVKTGIELAGRRINLEEVMGLLPRLPRLLGICCGLLAGFIALIMSRRILTAGQYIGGAFGGAGLLMLGMIPLMRSLRLREMVAEASELLAVQFTHLTRAADAGLVILAIGMAALGAVLMILGKRAWEKP